MLAWECVGMLYEWTGAAGVSPPHLGVNERVQPGYLPLTSVVYEMVQLGYLPLTLIWMNWCSRGISLSPHCSASRMAEAVGSASIGHRSDTFVPDRCLVGVGPGVFAMWDQDARMYFCIIIWCMYMLCSIWYVWNWIPDPISTPKTRIDPRRPCCSKSSTRASRSWFCLVSFLMASSFASSWRRSESMACDWCWMAFVIVSAMGLNTDSSFLMITGSDMTSMKASFISSLFSVLLGADEVLVGVVALLERSLSFQVDMEDHLGPQGLVLTDWPQQNGSTHCSAQRKVRSSRQTAK